MGSDWEHHTSIRPKRKKLNGYENNNEYKNEFNRAFNLFLDECMILNIIPIAEEIKNNGKYIISIDTSGENDNIIKNNNYHVKFLKSKFIGNNKFKSKLIEYYNSRGFFIKGPIKIDDTKWKYELTNKLL